MKDVKEEDEGREEDEGEEGGGVVETTSLPLSSEDRSTTSKPKTPQQTPSTHGVVIPKLQLEGIGDGSGGKGRKVLEAPRGEETSLKVEVEEENSWDRSEEEEEEERRGEGAEDGGGEEVEDGDGGEFLDLITPTASPTHQREPLPKPTQFVAESTETGEGEGEGVVDDGLDELSIESMDF